MINAIINWFDEHGPLAYVHGVKIKGSALSDAYRVYGDGIARAIPEKLVQRQGIQDTLKRISDMDLSA